MKSHLTFHLLAAALALAPAAAVLAQAPPVPPPAAPEVSRKPASDRPNLGVQLLPARPGTAGEGVLINYVYPGSAAEAMGFQAGDEVVGMDGDPIQDLEGMSARLRRSAIGMPVRFRMRRGGAVIELSGAMGGFQATRKAFLERLRRDDLGKPFATLAEIDWPEKIDGLRALRGRVAVLVSFDGCHECIEGNYRTIVERAEQLHRLNQDWIGFAGICSDQAGRAASAAGRARALERYPALFSIGVAHYPADRPPLEAAGRDPLVQHHGIAILDPEGKVLYLELQGFEADPSGRELTRVLLEAAERYGPKRHPPRPPAGPSGPVK